MQNERELLLVESHLKIALRCLEYRATMPVEELVGLLSLHVGSAAELLSFLQESARAVCTSNEVRSVVTREKEVDTEISKPKTEKKRIENPSAVSPRRSEERRDPVVVHETNVYAGVQREEGGASIRVERNVESKASNVIPESKSRASVAIPPRNRPADSKERAPQNLEKETKQQSTKTIADAYIARAITTTNEATHVEAVLGTRMTPLQSIQKGMTVNDRLRYAAELFSGDRARFTEVVSRLDAAHSLPEALEILHANFQGDADLPALKDFMQLIERRFTK